MSLNLTFLLFLPFSGCLCRPVLQSHEKRSSVVLFVFSVSINYLFHKFPCARSGSMSPKANEGQRARITVLYVNVCQSVCMCVCPVHRTRSALVLYFFFTESFIGRTFPCMSAESRSDVCGYSIRICVPVYNNTSVISISHELYEASFSPPFSGNPCERFFQNLILSVCFSMSCPEQADRERGRPSNIATRPKWPLKGTSREGWRNVHLTTLTASCYCSRLSVLCKVCIKALMVVLSVPIATSWADFSIKTYQLRK